MADVRTFLLGIVDQPRALEFLPSFSRCLHLGGFESGRSRMSMRSWSVGNEVCYSDAILHSGV